MTAMRLAAVGLVLGVACLILAFYPRGNPAVDAAREFSQDVAVASGAAHVSLRAINSALSMALQVEVGVLIVALARMLRGRLCGAVQAMG